ncbi:MAG: hypothetical protein SFT68_00900 [Rickettsiaceae bacterium]|nr:hypothetical protein [Rickettsiaceae bacterium]
MQLLKDRSIVIVNGEDAARFLQAQISNNIETLDKKTDPDFAIYTYFLNGGGRFLFDAFISTIGVGAYILDVNKIYAEKLIQRLEFLKINMKVEISLGSKWNIFYSRNRHNQDDTCLLKTYQDPRYKKMGYRIITESLRPNERDDNNCYMEDKYNFAIPDGFTDLIYEKSIPLEYGAEYLHSIAFDKGCYTGQEVITRTKTQGEIRKFIYKLIFDRDVNFANGEEIFQHERKVGKICSSWQNYAIAIIKTQELIKDEVIMCNNLTCRGLLAEFYAKSDKKHENYLGS